MLKLLVTLILLNICTTHGCSNKFLDELLSLLHKSSFSLLIIVCHPQRTMQRVSLGNWGLGVKPMHAKWGGYCIGGV